MHLMRKIFYLGYIQNQKPMNKFLLLSIIFFSLSCNNEKMNSEVFIQGGGTLNDWANLSRYAESNSELKKQSDANRVVFMGNSITEGLSLIHI